MFRPSLKALLLSLAAILAIGSWAVWADNFGNIKTDSTQIKADASDPTKIRVTLPTYTTAQRDALTGVATGEVLYNSTTASIQRYTGAAWDNFVVSTGAQTIGGAKTFSDTLAASGNATVGGTLGVTGNTTLSGALALTAAQGVTGFADKGGQVYSVKAFGAVGDGVTDDTAALLAARTAMAALTRPWKLVFPAGTYVYSSSPNWAIQDGVIEAEGEVRLRYTGTGVAVNLDGGAATEVFNCVFGDAGRFIIEAPNTATHAIYCRAFHASKVRAKVLGCGNTSAGLKTQFAVCSTFDVIVSVNHEGWYSALRPGFGYDLDQRGVGEQTCYCLFPNPIVEATDIGIKLTNTLGNTFVGGTSEGCDTYGVWATSGAALDKFIGVDFEANDTADIFAEGNGVEFTNCDCTGDVTFSATATKCQIRGGNYKSILLDAGSSACVVDGVVYNRLNDGGTFFDAGNLNRVHNIVDGGKTYPLSDGEQYVTLEDDFLGDALSSMWNPLDGSDAQATIAGGQGVLGGVVAMLTGDDAAADMATNGVQLSINARQWRANAGSLEIEFRVRTTAITNIAMFVGLTDNGGVGGAMEMPFTLAAGNTLTSNASDAVGVLFDTAADNDNWWLVGVAADTDATKQNTGVAPVANAWERWRIQITDAGVARFYRNGALVGSAMTGSVTPSTLLTPVIATFTRNASSQQIDCDRIKLRAKRS